VAGHAAVGVDDDLAAGQAGVADRAADHELAGRVDEEAIAEFVLVVAARNRGLEHRQHHLLPEIGLDRRLGIDPLGVLGGDQQLVDRDRAAFGVADADLGLAVGPEVVERAVLGPPRGARRGGGRYGSHRHQRLGLVAGVADIIPWSPAPSRSNSSSSVGSMRVS